MSLYDILGVASDADDATVRRAFVTLARRHHPDLAGGDASQMRAINDAWATLGDPARRARYDRLLAGGEPSRPAASSAATDPVDDPWDVDPDAEGGEQPVRVTVRLPGWVSLIPVGLFAGSVGTFVIGLIMVSQPLLGMSLMMLVLSVVFFLAAPFIALFAARTGGKDRESAQ
ncbi:MAG: J domain-containing protein [Microthrixaceae bacterium]